MNLNLLTRNDLNKLCRICMEMPSETDMQTEIFDIRSICDIDNQLSYSQCLYICTQIDLYNDIKVDNLLPQSLCGNCCRAIQLSYNFYNKVKQSQAQIANYINLLTNQSVALTAGNNIINTNIECVDAPEIISFCSVQDENANFKANDTSFIIDDFDDIIEEQLEDDYQMVELNKNDLNQTTIISYDDLRTPCKELIETLHNKNEMPATTTLFIKTDELSEQIDAAENYIIEELEEDDDANYKDLTIAKPRRIRHTGSYRCNICYKIFPNFSRMSTHRRSHDINRLKYLCPHCDRLYCTKQALNTHIRGVHKKSGFNCPICMKLFAIKKHLEIHMRYHTGDFPYECDMCHKKFAQMGHLNTHRDVKHNNVRFSCEYPDCGKFFTSSNSLRNHEFSHGVMPFECKLCHQGFPAKSKLRLHVKRKHDQELTKEQLEDMRKFHVVRSRVNVVKLIEPNCVL